MKKAKLIIVAFVSTLVLASCGDSSSDDDVMVYQVSVAAKPDYFDTTRFGDTLPLNALAVGQGGPDTLANNINGFSHSFGTQYELEIRRYPVTENGQIGTIHELVRIISSQPDDVGTVYQYPEVVLVSNPIFKDENGEFRFSPYKFLCGENVDCETLVSIADDGGVVSIEFTLTDNQAVPITLTNWQ